MQSGETAEKRVTQSFFSKVSKMRQFPKLLLKERQSWLFF
jgi:hypothetical protein